MKVPRVNIGDGATIQWWTDRTACTVIAVSTSGRQVTVQEDLATRIDSNGLSDTQTYRYQPNPKGRIWRFSLRKNGQWVQVGETITGGLTLVIGFKRTYHDYGF